MNLSYADPNRSNISFRPETPARALTVSQARERRRLGAVQGDQWFSFGATSAGEFRGEPVEPAELLKIINGLWLEAEDWWKSKRDAEHSS